MKKFFTIVLLWIAILGFGQAPLEFHRPVKFDEYISVESGLFNTKIFPEYIEFFKDGQSTRLTPYGDETIIEPIDLQLPNRSGVIATVEDLNLQTALENGSTATIITPLSIQSDNGDDVKGSIVMDGTGLVFSGQAGGITLSGDNLGTVIQGSKLNINTETNITGSRLKLLQSTDIVFGEMLDEFTFNLKSQIYDNGSVLTINTFGEHDLSIVSASNLDLVGDNVGINSNGNANFGGNETTIYGNNSVNIDGSVIKINTKNAITSINGNEANDDGEIELDYIPLDGNTIDKPITGPLLFNENARIEDIGDTLEIVHTGSVTIEGTGATMQIGSGVKINDKNAITSINGLEANDDGEITVSGGASNYSTTESLTGGTWIDGKPIYRKVLTGISNGTPDNLPVENVNLASLNIETIIPNTLTGTADFEGSILTSLNYSKIVEFNTGLIGERIRNITYNLSTNNLVIESCKRRYDPITGDIGDIIPEAINYNIVLEYTKTTD